jgi:predicted molibdopterin-dependent oxidoreductase YjgC
MSGWKRTGSQTGSVTILVDGHEVEAVEGETVATVLLRIGLRSFGCSPVDGKPRAPACMMGVCFGCLCTIDGRPGAQACLEVVRDGLIVDTQRRMEQ